MTRLTVGADQRVTLARDRLGNRAKPHRHAGCVTARTMSTKSHARSERRKHLNQEPTLTEEDRIAGEILVAFLGALSFGTLQE